jgi:hypothetical protein
MGVPGKWVENGPEIDVTDWWSGEFGVFNKQIGRSVNDAIRGAFEDDPPDAYFPYGYGDGEGDDPLEIYVNIPLGEAVFENPQWAFNLRDVVFYTISAARVGDGPLEDEAVAPHQAIAQALRNLADEIDSTIDIPRAQE